MERRRHCPAFASEGQFLLDPFAFEKQALAVGGEEGLSPGVVRVALSRPDRINCSWLVSLNQTDLDEQTGVLSEEKLSKLGEMLRLGGLE